MGTSSRVTQTNPYEFPPRLPEGEVIDPRTLFLSRRPEEAGPVEVRSASAPVELEIGPGRGWFTIERIDADPEVRLIGFEIKKKWATIVDDRLKKRNYAHRGRVFAEDVRHALPRLSAASISRAYLHFPDPWWKKRHEKRLVLTESVLEELVRVLVPGGEFLIQTDVSERADQYEALVAGSDRLVPIAASARVADHPFVARSPRERKAMEDGLPIYRLHYKKLSAP